MEKLTAESEYEQISHPQLKNIHFLLVNLTYRTPHLHTDFEILQIIEGGLHIKTQEDEFTLGPGEIAVFNPNQLHLLQSVDSSCIVLTIQVSPAFCKAYYPELLNIRFENGNLSACAPFEAVLAMIRLCMSFGCSYLEQAPESSRTPEQDKAIQSIFSPEEGLAILKRHMPADGVTSCWYGQARHIKSGALWTPVKCFL